MESRIDLGADLNDEDDEGLLWVMLVAGNRQAQAVVRVVAVDDDGRVTLPCCQGPWRTTTTSSAAP